MSGPYANISEVDSQLANRLVTLQKKLEINGAPAAARRLELAASQLDKLNPEMVYQWTDPSRIYTELEDARGKLARKLAGWRNALALAPLVLTWVALGWASGQYQAQVNAALHPTGGGQPDLVTANTPFLVLWEQGFGHPSFLTFSHTAFLDFLLLAGILVLTILAQLSDAGAHRTAVRLVAEVDGVIAPMAEIAARGVLPQNASPNDWARVVQNTVREVMNEAKQVAERATAVVKDVGAASTDLIRKEMQPLVAEFKGSVGTLGAELQTYQTSVATISKTVTDLGDAAGKVAAASTTLSSSFGQYQQTAASIDRNILELSTNQRELATQSGQLAGALTTAAQTTGAMVQRLDDAVRKYQQTENQLNATATQLSTASTQLATASKRLKDVVVGGAGGRRGGILGWLLG